MFKFPTQSCQRMLLVFCFLSTSMLVISTQPEYSQTMIPSHGSKRPIAGLARILRQPAVIENAPCLFYMSALSISYLLPDLESSYNNACHGIRGRTVKTKKSN